MKSFTARLCLPKMLSGANESKISDLQEAQMGASLVRRLECRTMLHCVENRWAEFLRTTGSVVREMSITRE